MNKSQFLARLQSQSEWVSSVIQEQELDEGRTGGNLKLYDVKAIVKLPDSNAVQCQTQGFYVKDEGLPTESVWPVNGERKSDPHEAFRARIRTYLNTLITARRPKIVIDQLDGDNEFALVTAYELENATNKIRLNRYFIAIDDSGNEYSHEFAG